MKTTLEVHPVIVRDALPFRRHLPTTPSCLSRPISLNVSLSLLPFSSSLSRFTPRISPRFHRGVGERPAATSKTIFSVAAYSCVL